MIKNLKLFHYSHGHLVESRYSLINISNLAPLIGFFPLRVDICFDHLNVYYKGTEEAFSCCYSYDYIPYVKDISRSKDEMKNLFCYKLTFINPRDCGKTVSYCVLLTKKQYFQFLLFQSIMWMHNHPEIILGVLFNLLTMLHTLCAA